MHTYFTYMCVCIYAYVYTERESRTQSPSVQVPFALRMLQTFLFKCLYLYFLSQHLFLWLFTHNERVLIKMCSSCNIDFAEVITCWHDLQINVYVLSYSNLKFQRCRRSGSSAFLTMERYLFDYLLNVCVIQIFVPFAYTKS